MDILSKKDGDAGIIKIRKHFDRTVDVVIETPFDTYMVFEVIFENGFIKTVEYNDFKYEVTKKEGLELEELIDSKRLAITLSDLCHMEDYLSSSI